jgi:hypothetical protein
VSSRRLLLLALLTAAAAGHVVFWYLPRERAVPLDPGSAAGELFATGPQAVRAWIPYPHQNVGVAARAMEDPATALAAVSRLAGLGDVELPAFGPFAMPPSGALSIAIDEGGENLEVVIEVFPAVALLARVAGLIADNPLLRGGAVRLSGREVEVAWRGRAWCVRARAAAADDVPRASGEDADRTLDRAGRSAIPAGDHLGLLAVSARRGLVEPGVYRLHHDGRDLLLESSGTGAWREVAALAAARAREHDLAFVGLRAEGESGATVLVMPRTGEGGFELPDAAVGWTGDARRFSLPGERVLRLLGHDLLESRAEAWDLVAIDSPSLAAATGVAPELGRGARAAGVTLVLWIRPRDYLPLVSAVAEVLDTLPLAPAEDAAYWRDLQTLLEALGPVERLSAVVAESGAGARLGWGGG